MKKTIAAVMLSAVMAENDATIYTNVCVDNPAQCDYNWSEDIPIEERLPWATLFDWSQFEDMSEHRSYN